MSRFLFVTWDGAGNLVPTLGLARRLAARQHDVRVLGHRSIDARVGRAGWRFRELRWTAEVDSARGRDGGDDMHAMARQVWFDGGICAEVRDELSRESADLLVGDCLLPVALCTAEAMQLPAVALFHGALAPFLSGPFADLLARMLLADAAAADAARHMARVIAGYDGGAAVVGAMERIAEAAITAAR